MNVVEEVRFRVFRGGTFRSRFLWAGFCHQIYLRRRPFVRSIGVGSYSRKLFKAVNHFFFRSENRNKRFFEDGSSVLDLFRPIVVPGNDVFFLRPFRRDIDARVPVGLMDIEGGGKK